MLTAISLYSGIGGLDFGFEAAGFHTRAALELDKTACQTIRLNRKWKVIEDDINHVASKTLLSRAELKPGQADVPYRGGPLPTFLHAIS